MSKQIQSLKPSPWRDIAELVGFLLFISGIACYDYRAALVSAGATMLILAIAGRIRK